MGRLRAARTASSGGSARHDGRQIKDRGRATASSRSSPAPARRWRRCAPAAGVPARAVAAEAPLRVRMGLHTGEATLGSAATTGDGHRTPASAPWPTGADLLSQSTHDLLRDALPKGPPPPLGRHLLKGLERPEEVYQVCTPRCRPSSRRWRRPALRSNLPLQQQLCGRGREQQDVAALLRRGPLVTLSGAGGAGKTRLALQVAGRCWANTRWVWLVELAPLADPPAAAGYGTRPGRAGGAGPPLLACVADSLQPKRLLLLLDNCEHLVAACANWPRAAAGLPGPAHPGHQPEGLGWRARPSTGCLPWRAGSGALASPEQLAQCEAVALFVARARERRADFALAAGMRGRWRRSAPAGRHAAGHRAAAARSVSCGGADCRPAGRVLPAADGRAAHRRAAPADLRAALDWSYELLGEQEGCCCGDSPYSRVAGHWKRRRRSVRGGSGGWAVWTCFDGWRTSRCAAEAVGRRRAYRLLETMRQYGRERLEAAAGSAVRDRHLGCGGVWPRRRSRSYQTGAGPLLESP